MARARITGTNIVLAGAWNPAIFTPEWASKRLFGVEEVLAEIDLARGNHRLLASGLKVSVSLQRILIEPDTLSDDSLKSVEKCAKTIAKTLPETPVVAVGFNFAWQVFDAPEIDRVLRPPDQSALEGLGSVEHSAVVRKISVSDHLVAVTIERDRSSKTTISFNHHFDLPRINPETAKVFHNEQARNCLNWSVSLLQNAYQIEGL